LATEAASHTVSGFFQALGFTAGGAVLALLGALGRHASLILIAIVTFCFGAIQWKSNRTMPLPGSIGEQVSSTDYDK
jgi:hypothetical protein